MEGHGSEDDYDEELFSLLNQLPPPDLSFLDIQEKEASSSSCKEEKRSVLSKETISQYFYRPITDAANELNVGMTTLKKRCRELGIRRWPYRKLASLRTLAKNIHELGKDEGEFELVKRETKLMEEVPDLKLEKITMRLRQECFKAIYKKKKKKNIMSQSII